jgi:hypothetical protein
VVRAGSGDGPLSVRGCPSTVNWSTVLRIPLRGTRLRRAVDPGDRCGPWEQEQRAGPGLPPRCARRANPGDGGPQEQAGRQDIGELAFDSHKERENYKPRVVSRIKRGPVKDQVRLDNGGSATGLGNGARQLSDSD